MSLLMHMFINQTTVTLYKHSTHTKPQLFLKVETNGIKLYSLLVLVSLTSMGLCVKRS